MELYNFVDDILNQTNFTKEIEDQVANTTDIEAQLDFSKTLEQVTG